MPHHTLSIILKNTFNVCSLHSLYLTINLFLSSIHLVLNCSLQSINVRVYACISKQRRSFVLHLYFPVYFLHFFFCSCRFSAALLLLLLVVYIVDKVWNLLTTTKQNNNCARKTFSSFISRSVCVVQCVRTHIEE